MSNRTLPAKLLSSRFLPFLLIHNLRAIQTGALNNVNLLRYGLIFIHASLPFAETKPFAPTLFFDFEEGTAVERVVLREQWREDGSEGTNYLLLPFKLSDGSFVTIQSTLVALLSLRSIPKHIHILISSLLPSVTPSSSQPSSPEIVAPKGVLEKVNTSLDAFLEDISDPSSSSSTNDAGACKTESKLQKKGGFACSVCHSSVWNENDKLLGYFGHFYYDNDACLLWWVA